MNPDLASYDYIVISSSGGKDSQAMLCQVVEQCDSAGVSRAKLVVVHSDLGRVEWPGVKQLIRQHADAYGLPCVVVKRPQGDLLDHVAQRGMWPSPAARYCTSDHKRSQVQKFIRHFTRKDGDYLRILNCIGLRAEESRFRAGLVPFERDKNLSCGIRRVDTWLPIHGWTTSQVWERIRQSGLPHHPAYDLGMPRLSCVFCIFSPKEALMLAGKHNRPLLDEYARIEREINHTFKPDLSLAQIAEALDRGEQPATVATWEM